LFAKILQQEPGTFGQSLHTVSIPKYVPFIKLHPPEFVYPQLGIQEPEEQSVKQQAPSVCE
jgi:hypothetical protein